MGSAVYQLLNAALAAVGQSPCEAYQCAMRARCGQEKMACYSFKKFVETGKAMSPHVEGSLKPTKGLFIRLYKDVFDFQQPQSTR